MIKYGTVYYLLAAMLLVRSSLLNVHTVSYFFVNKPNDVGNCLVFQLEWPMAGWWRRASLNPDIVSEEPHICSFFFTDLGYTLATGCAFAEYRPTHKPTTLR